VPSKTSAGYRKAVSWLVGDRLLTEEKWRAMVGAEDVVRLDGKRLDLGALIAEIDTLPMFAPHKWILVQDFRVPGKRADDDGGASKADAEMEKKLLAALGRVGPAVTLILVSESGDKRTRFYKRVQEIGEYLELAGFKEYETGRFIEWVTKRLRGFEKQISPEHAAELVEAVGPDLPLLASEIQKLAIAMGDDSAVTDQHLEVIAGSPVALRKLIEEGIVRRRPARAEALLLQALSANEHPLRVLNFVIPRIRDLLRARLYPQGRGNAEQAAAVFGPMHPFRLRTLYEEAARFTPEELRAAMHSLVLADTCLKSSVEPHRVLSLLIAALSGGIDHASFERAVRSYTEPWD